MSACARDDGLPLGRYYPDLTGDIQAPVDVAVAMPTIGRPSVARALSSIYEQRGVGRVQILVGIDGDRGPEALQLVKSTLAKRPKNVSAVLLTLPYSTVAQNGGVHNPRDGGSTRPALALIANSRRLAFLDDDNTWLPDHLALLSQALEGKAYAFSRRMLVDDVTDRDLGVDRWHSVGPNKGDRAHIGGLVDTNCLMIDKVLCVTRLGAWAETWNGTPGELSDQKFFSAIHMAPHGEVEEVTVRYRIRRNDVLHARLGVFQKVGKVTPGGPTSVEAPEAALKSS